MQIWLEIPGRARYGRPRATILWHCFFWVAMLRVAAIPSPATCSETPWTPLKAQGTTVECWGRTYSLAPSGLPQQIVSNGEELLAGPVAFVVNGQDVMTSSRMEFDRVADDAVTWTATGTSGGLVYRCHGRAEFDGMMRFDVAVEGETGEPVQSVLLAVPVQPRQATLFHYYPLQYDYPGVTFFKPDRPNSIARPPQWKGPFTPFVWLGNEDRGLQWFCESDEGWVPSDASAAIQIFERSGVAVLELHLRDSTARGIAKFEVTFGLMAGPVKPRTPVMHQGDVRYAHWASYDMAEQIQDGSNPPVSRLDHLKHLGAQFVGLHEEWTDFEGMARVTQPEQLRHLVAAVHDRGMGLVLYQNMLLPDIAPEFATMADACLCEPRSAFYVHSREPKQLDYAACYRSRWSQVSTDGISQLFRDYGIDGVYLDGAATPVGCVNERHGCGYARASGERRPTWPIFAAREQMRRLRQICDAQGKPTVIVAHMSSAITLPTLSFADVLLTGEQYWKAAADFRPPIEFFRVECMGHPHGIPTHFIGYAPLGGDFAKMMIAIHQSPSSWCPGGVDIWRYYEAFDVDRAMRVPYWAAKPLADTGRKDVLASGHVSKQQVPLRQLAAMLPPSLAAADDSTMLSARALLAIGNTAQTPVHVSLRLKEDVLGFSLGRSGVCDVERRELIEVREGQIPLSLEPEGVRWLLLFEESRGE